MQEYFPLYFKKTEKGVVRGLSTNQSEKLSPKPQGYSNPRHIPNRDPCYSLTLVWDLDQTLVSADGINDEKETDPDTELVIRPHAREILNILRRNSNVEFIVWTAGNKEHSERVVGSFPDIKFDHIISRHRSWYDDETPAKNLNLISNETRPLETIILIDDRMDIGMNHPENLLIVPPYYPKKGFAADDSTMLYLVNILQRAIDNYDNKNNFSSFLFSPLTEKCVYEDHTYYGVKCFKDQKDLEDRIWTFQKIIPVIKNG